MKRYSCFLKYEISNAFNYYKAWYFQQSKNIHLTSYEEIGLTPYWFHIKQEEVSINRRILIKHQNTMSSIQNEYGLKQHVMPKTKYVMRHLTKSRAQAQYDLLAISQDAAKLKKPSFAGEWRIIMIEIERIQCEQ